MKTWLVGITVIAVLVLVCSLVIKGLFLFFTVVHPYLLIHIGGFWTGAISVFLIIAGLFTVIYLLDDDL